MEVQDQKQSVQSNQQEQNKEITRAPDKPNNPTRVWKTWNLPAKAGGYQIVGFSRAADRTFFHVPEMKIALDAGGCRGRQPDTVHNPPAPFSPPLVLNNIFFVSRFLLPILTSIMLKT